MCAKKIKKVIEKRKKMKKIVKKKKKNGLGSREDALAVGAHARTSNTLIRLNGQNNENLFFSAYISLY